MGSSASTQRTFECNPKYIYSQNPWIWNSRNITDYFDQYSSEELREGFNTYPEFLGTLMTNTDHQFFVRMMEKLGKEYLTSILQNDIYIILYIQVENFIWIVDFVGIDIIKQGLRAKYLGYIISQAKQARYQFKEQVIIGGEGTIPEYNAIYVRYLIHECSFDFILSIIRNEQNIGLRNYIYKCLVKVLNTEPYKEKEAITHYYTSDNCYKHIMLNCNLPEFYNHRKQIEEEFKYIVNGVDYILPNLGKPVAVYCL